ncbi:MAG TPA: hypothetical protein PK156_08290 [Polyangium sp.]|nr:hypothetical protein [Polyangium sp.]
MALDYVLQKFDALGPLGPRAAISIDQTFLGSNDAILLFRSALGVDSFTLDAVTSQTVRAEDQLKLAGTTTLFGLENVQVTLVLREGNGELVTSLDILAPPGWTLAKTCPSLPMHATRYADADDGEWLHDANFLTQLSFGVVHLICSSIGYIDEARGCEIKPGLNLVGELYPQGILYPIGYVLQQLDPMFVHGPIKEFIGTYDPLKFTGIRLRAPLALDLTRLGSVEIQKADLYMKSGLTEYERDPIISATQGNGIYMLAQATLGGRPVELIGKYDIAGASSDLTLRGTFTDFGVAGFSSLSQTVGVEGFDTMPEELQSPSGISLTEFSVTFDCADYAIHALSVGVGLPVHWEIVPGTMTLTEIGVLFSVLNPFGSGLSISTTLTGLLAFDKFNLAAYMEFPSYDIGAGLPEGETLPLGDVLESLLPGDTGLPEMTVSQMILRAAPKQGTFSLATTVRDLLSISVGATSFDISGLVVMFNYAKAAGIEAVVTAQMSIAGASAVLAGEINHEVTLSGSLENFDLKNFWSLVTGGDSLPDAVPDIVFQRLALRYTPKTGAFSAQGQASIAWDFISKGNALTTTVEFSFTRSVIVTEGSSTSTINASLSLQGAGPIDIAPGLQLGAFNFLFDYRAGSGWKLSGGINADIFDTALYLQAGYERNQLGDKLTLQFVATPDMKLIDIPGIGSYAFHQFDLLLDLRDNGNGKKQTFFDLRLASTLKLDGIFTIGGYSSISKNETGTESLIFKPNPGSTDFAIHFPTGEGMGIWGEVFEVGFMKYPSGNWGFSGSVYIGFTGLSGGIAAALPSKMFAKLEVGGNIASISTVNVTDPMAVALPSTGGKDMGKLFVQVLSVGVAIRPALGLTTDVGLGFPAEINAALGNELFRVYEKDNPLTMCRIRCTITSTGVAAQFLTPPFAAVNTVMVNEEAWFDIDFGKYGAISLKMPTFLYDGVSQYFEAGGGCKVTRPLAIPLVPLKAFLLACGSKDFADMFPDKVPIEALSLVDDQNNLKVDELIAFIEQVGDVPNEVTQALKRAGNLLNRFPDGFKQYFKIEVPETLEFKFGFSPTGRVSLALLAPETPVRVLFSSVVASYVPLPGLTGMEVRKIAVGTISAGSLFYGEVDAVIDQFDMPSLALSLMLPTDEDFPLPTSDQLQRRLVLENVFCMIAGVVPIPVFYDEIGFDYLGIEGLGVGVHISFPQPPSDGLQEFMTTLQTFVTDSKARLDPKTPPGGMDLAFRFWDEYLQAPEYLGGGVLGMKGKQATISLWQYVATMMNFFKSFSVNDFVGAIPYEYRVGSKSYKFAFLHFDADWLITTPEEFRNGAFQQLKLTASDRDDFIDVLPAVTSAQGKTVAGHEQGLVTFVRGEADLGFVRLELVFGLAASGTLGFNTGFKIAGGIGNVVDLELSGAIMVNAPLAERGPAAPAPTPPAAAAPGEKLQHDGLILNGKGDYATIATSNKFATSKYTLEVWIRPDENPAASWQEVWGGNGKSAKLLIHNSGLISHRFYSGGQARTYNTTEGLIHWGQWNHLAITNDGTTYRTYVNGVERSSGAVTGALVCEAAAIQIGRQHDGQNQYFFSGSIDDLRYFSVARTQAQIELDMDVALQGNEAGLVAYYNMDHTSGNQLVDLGPNNLGGTVNGAQWALAMAPADTPRAAIQIQGHTHLTVAGHKALVGDLRLVDSEFWFTGDLNLFPSNWPLRVDGHVEGMLSGKRFYLSGETTNQLFGLLLSKSRLYLANDEIRLEGRWMGLYTLLEISWDKNDPYMRGSLDFSKSVLIDFGTIRLKGVKVADNVRITVAIDATLNAVIIKTGFSADVNAKFTISGNAFALGFNIQVAPSEVGQVFDQITQKIIADPLKYLGHLFADATTWLANVGTGAIAFSKNVGKDLGSALKTGYAISRDALGPMLKGAGFDANVVGSALTDAYGATAEEAARLLKGAQYGVSEVGDFLKLKGIDAQTAARYLKNVGFSSNDVGAALQSAYAKNYKDAAKLLKNAGFNSDQVSSALRQTFKVNDDAAAVALKGAGFSAKEIGSSLKSIYGTSSDDIGKILKSAGFSADDIADVMKNVYGMSAKSTAKYLRGTLDYGKGTVKDAMKSAGFSSKDINNALDWLGGLF